MTAVARNGDEIHAIAFARTGDTATYETQVADATPAALADTAANLAAGGYIITAFGRNGDGPLLLVGTRPTGVTTPHTITTQTSLTPVLADHGAIVASIFYATDPTPTFATLTILEQ